MLRFLTGGNRTAEESVGQVQVADDSTYVGMIASALKK